MSRGRSSSWVVAFAALALSLPLSVLSGCETSHEFEPTSLGEPEQARTPVAVNNRQFVRSVYADVLHRAPEVYDFVISDATGAELFRFPVDEEASLVAALDGVGDPDALRASLAAGLVTSVEVSYPEKAEVSSAEGFIVEQFQGLLGRDPTPYELAAFLAEWQNDPAVGPRTVVRALVGSREYQSR
jgi:hypothetical protein